MTEYLKILPLSSPLTATLNVPGSKSLSNRALLFAAFAKGESTLSSLLQSDDTASCLKVLSQLKIPLSQEKDTVTVQGCGGNLSVDTALLNFGSAGTVGRFLPALLAAHPKGIWKCTASEQLCARPLSPLIQALHEQGAEFHFPGRDNALPFTLISHGLRGGVSRIPTKASSQFFSAMLQAAPYAAQPLSLAFADSSLSDEPYIQLSLDLMKSFGVEPKMLHDHLLIQVPQTPYQGAKITIEADANTAGYFLALAALTQSQITVRNLKKDTYQPTWSFFNLLEQMGCSITDEGQGVSLKGPAVLRGGFTVDMRPMSEMALTLAAMAPFLSGPITMTNIGHIKGHETNRIKAMEDIFRGFGLDARVFDDGITLIPGDPYPFVEVDTRNDHRIAMSFALTGLKKGGVVLKNPSCVSKTCPTYFEMLRSIGASVQVG